MRNAIETVGHLVVQRMPSSPTNDEFMEMTEYVMESFHALLAEELESPSNFDSSRGSHHPSRECFMVGTQRDTSKASTRKRLPQRMTLTMRPGGCRGPASPMGGAAEGPTLRA